MRRILSSRTPHKTLTTGFIGSRKGAYNRRCEVQTCTAGPNYFAPICALIWTSATAKTLASKGANRLGEMGSIFLSRKIGFIRNENRLASHRIARDFPRKVFPIAFPSLSRSKAQSHRRRRLRKDPSLVLRMTWCFAQDDKALRAGSRGASLRMTKRFAQEDGLRSCRRNAQRDKYET